MNNSKPKAMLPNPSLIALGIGAAVILFAITMNYPISEVWLPGGTIIKFGKQESPEATDRSVEELPGISPQPSPEPSIPSLPQLSPESPQILPRVTPALPHETPYTLPSPYTLSSPYSNSSEGLQTIGEVFEQTQNYVECLHHNGSNCSPYGP